ncbi:TPA: hypothetical protein RQK60_004589 [Vibrio vulnificus]|nr:hypothetical protein [Vibrio vulnificus]
MYEDIRVKLSFLELVFPPISNQEAYWLKDQPVADYMRASDFYMIGGKMKSKFSNLVACDKLYQLLLIYLLEVNEKVQV